MPEVISRHPEITLKVLKDANIQCGVGAQQTILTTCPKDRFCKLPSGELCVYGIQDIPQMTQINTADFITTALILPIIAWLFISFALGMGMGISLSRK